MPTAWRLLTGSPVLPEGMCVAKLAQGPADLEHRRVGRQDVERLARRCGFEGCLYCSLAVWDDGAEREVGVFEADRHVLGPRAAHHKGLQAVCVAFCAGVGEHLEVHVPEP